MAVTATIPIVSIPIGTLSGNDVLVHQEWARFFRDIQVRSGGVTGVITVPSGGTGYSSYSVGDMLYADTTSSLARLNAASAGNALLSGAAPSWGKIGLTSHVSGILPESNGGTGFPAFGTGVSAWLQDPSSANIAAALTDKTGTGVVVFNDGPVFIAPELGTPASGNLSNCTGYPTGALSGTVPVGQGGTGITSGTSGGVPYYSSSSTIASSAALTANRIVLGGGAGAAPSVLGSLGTTSTVLHGNAAGAPTFGPVSLTADVSGTLPIANGGTGNTSGNAATATALETPRNINGVAFDGTAAITVTAAAGTLSGATLAAGVTASSLTSVGTLTSLTMAGAISGATDLTTSGNTILGNATTDTLNVGNGGLVKDSAGRVLIGTTAFDGVGTIAAQIGDATRATAGLLTKSTSSSVSLYASSTSASYIVWKTGTPIELGEGPDNLASFTGRMGIDSGGQIIVRTAGKGLSVTEGSNCKQGVATLVAGAVTVANTSVTANSRIFLTSQADGGTPGFLRVSARTAATSFTITSSSGTDTSSVAYEIFEPS